MFLSPLLTLICMSTINAVDGDNGLIEIDMDVSDCISVMYIQLGTPPITYKSRIDWTQSDFVVTDVSCGQPKFDCSKYCEKADSEFY